MASIPPAAANSGSVRSGASFRIDFEAGGARLNDSARKQIDEIAQELAKNDSLRLQLFAFASGGERSGNNPRRLSLSRALAVRSELIDKGIKGRRIDVRAEGDKYKDGPPDRVDMIVTSR